MRSTRHLIIFGDSRKMHELASESVHLVVTSPPYWDLKDYGHPGQIGFGQSYVAFLSDLLKVWRECFRVLMPGCRMCVVVGDVFRSDPEGWRAVPLHADIIVSCREAGFVYLGTVIWRKASTLNSSGGGKVLGSYPYPRNGIPLLNHEYVLLFRKPGEAPIPTAEQKEASKLSREEWRKCFSGLWQVQGESQEHQAAFPLEIPGRLIKMFSFVGETVLDPFLGSGTTSLAAMKLGRNSVGYEINPGRREEIEAKLLPAREGLFGRAEVEFVFRNGREGDHAARHQDFRGA